VEILRKNFGLKLLALALAILGWAYFRFASNPLLAARFDQQISVPINVLNLPVGYVAHFTEHEAVITIASQRGEAAVRPDEVKAVLDLSGKVAGAYNVPVQLVAPDVVVQSLSPASVTLTLEAILAKVFPAAIHYSDAQPGIVVNSVQISPASATVRGAQSVVSEVASLRLDMTMPQSPRAVDIMVRPVPVDAQGNEVDDVQVSPNLIRVQASFQTGSSVNAGGKH
jgi:YbbR domain-containing protein